MINKKLIGELKLHPDGYGFVVADKPGASDAFIPAPFVGWALHGDLVEVSLKEGRRGKGPEGRITNILKRGRKELVGRLEHVGKEFRVISDDRRVRNQIIIPSNKLNNAKHGQYVIVKITDYPDDSNPMYGEVLRTLGERGLSKTEIETIIVKHNLLTDFTEKVMSQDVECRKRLEEGLKDKDRKDLTHIPFVTIDGETAKDFDDAISAEMMSDGKIKLWIAIADVSWFVKPFSIIDESALERSTSVYFPSLCLPMLPEFLSTDLCSLVPDEKRLVLTAELLIDKNGHTVHSDFYRGTMLSRRRLTYKETAKAMEEKDATTRERLKSILPTLDTIYEAYYRLKDSRTARGSIDFDLPEPEIILDITGDVSSIIKTERFKSHMVVENIMIAANEAVAKKLQPNCMFRVHEPPPRKNLETLGEFLKHIGFAAKLKSCVTSKKYANIVGRSKGTVYEKLVNGAILRSMSQAVYSVQNLGHFGLASNCYCHFTSPIRRYPDLVVHRLLCDAISKTKRKWVQKKMESLSAYCSRMERTAMEAERDSMKYFASAFMKDKVGAEYDGIISHLGKFGLVVQLLDVFIEGRVPIEEIPGKFKFDSKRFELFDRKSKKHMKIGQKVRVRVDCADVIERQIIFSLV